MKKIFALLVMFVFLASIFSLPSLADMTLKSDISISEKKESLAEATIKIKDYVISVRDSIESSNLISESEKTVIIEKLDEKSIKMDSYILQIETVNSKSEVDEIKYKLKEDINEIKPLTEKSIIKIQKSKISSSISKLKSISKKLGMIMSFMDESEKSKIKELKNLIDSANEKLEKAEKLSSKKQSESNLYEIKLLLKEATKEIKQAFDIVKGILSQMENDVLNDLESYESEKSEKTSELDKKTDTIDKMYINDIEYQGSCDNFVMVWRNDTNNPENIVRKEKYNVIDDTCNGFRTILGYELSPSCYSKEECNELTLKCVSINKLKKQCNSEYTKKSVDKESINNIYVDLNKAFELKEGDSAKAIIDKKDGSKDSIIITLKQTSKDRTNYAAGTNINYWIDNENVKNVYNSLLEGQRVEINDYIIKILSVGKGEAKYIIEYEGEILDKKIVKQTFATGDIIEGVELLSVDVNGNSCSIKYQGMVYTIKKGDKITMPDGTQISVIRAIPTQTISDYCNIVIDTIIEYGY